MFCENCGAPVLDDANFVLLAVSPSTLRRLPRLSLSRYRFSPPRHLHRHPCPVRLSSIVTLA